MNDGLLCDTCGVPIGAPHLLLPTDCILGHADHQPRRFGYACGRHFHWIDRTLAQIAELFALTDDVLIPGPVEGRHGTRFGSPAPGRVEVMALTDRRARGIGESTQEDDIPDVPGVLFGWVRMLLEEREDLCDEPDGTVTDSIRLLRRERQWMAARFELDLFCEEIADLHRAVARAVGDTMWPRPIGKCPNDGSLLYNTVGIDTVTCRRCKATWTGIHLARLRLIHEMEGSTA